ncbi:hypothetical protein DPMN_100570 [Dreissena polymorpha]|uniref:Uncharacterized protein n=1 Tax=Dreissena polymorpha TaxID=45954 RepID=A0A9D4LIF2_DREPO|nr:hypothetical protein DPMN_100570 [Dreissena polymorpha]
MRVRKKMKEANEEWIDEQFIIIDKELTAWNNKKAYSTLKTLTKTNKTRRLL